MSRPLLTAAVWRRVLGWRAIAPMRWRVAAHGPFPASTGRGRSYSRSSLVLVHRAGLAALLLASSPLVVACSSDPTCGDVTSLQRKLDGMSPDDPDYNSTNDDLNLAQADCNANGGGGY